MNTTASATQETCSKKRISTRTYLLQLWFVCLALLTTSSAFATGPAPDRVQARYEVFFMQDMIVTQIEK